VELPESKEYGNKVGDNMRIEVGVRTFFFFKLLS
jgi:hypothetical protein